MTVQINKEHLAFVEEAKQAFEENHRLETYHNKDGEYIALRYGLDRDCIMVYELGQPVANFVQQFEKQPAVRAELDCFAREMEKQLLANDQKGGWESCATDYLMNRLDKNLRKLTTCVSHSEFRRRCANIANFAMMLSDNDRREEADRS